MAPNRVAGGTLHSSSSGIFFSADGQSQVLGNSSLGSSFGNSVNVMPGNGRMNLGPLSGDVNNMVLNSVATSAPSVGASSLVTDANSGLSGGAHLQRSASFNTESYMRLPASPLSFSSNNISISGSSIVDGSSVVHPNSNQDPNRQQQQGASSATSLPASRSGQIQLPNGTGSFIQDTSYLSQLQKKPRLDIKQEGVLSQQVLQQLLQRQDPLHLQNSNSQLQALIQQQRLRQQQQQMLQSMPPGQRAQLLQQQQLQLRQQIQQQGVQPSSAVKRPYDGGVCSRRLMQYLYHQRQRPPDNSIAYWRKFVAEYYAPGAKKRWCLSLYDNVGHHSLGVFPQAAMDAWQCDICGSKSGRGFEATFEVLPRLNEIKFASGVIDELLFLDLPRECRFSSGIMMLEYGKAVQESVYEQLRVVREGQLRIVFKADLKILSWEFCARRHEELLPRRLVAPQVNQVLQVAQKCQSTISESGPDGVSQQDLQANSNMVVTAGRQLARSLESQALNDLGFSKRYVRCLQIAEVVNSTKDLMDFCKDHKVGPMEGLKTFPRHASSTKLQPPKQEIDQSGATQGLSSDRSTISNLAALHPGLSSSHATNNPQRMGIEALSGSAQALSGSAQALDLSGSAQAALALTNYQNLLMRQNSVNGTRSSLQPEPSSSMNGSNPNPSGNPNQGSTSNVGGSLQTSAINGLSGFNLQQQQPLPQRLLQGNALFQQNILQPSQGSQALQQQMIQQLMQEMTNNGGSGVQQQYIAGQSINGMVSKNSVGFENSTPSGGISTGNGTNGPGAPSRSNSFKATSHGESPAGGGNSGFNHKSAQSLHFPDEGVPDVTHDFTENGFLSGDLDENMGFDWKV